MRQVPKYLLIGSGRLAQNLKKYFSFLKIPLGLWSRNNNPDFNERLSEFPDSQDRLQIISPYYSHLLLAVSDSNIKQVAKLAQTNSDQTLIHFSGALSFDDIYGAHPLMTFSTKELALDDYKKIAFITEDSQPSFRDLFPQLPNPFHSISSEQKLLYHCYCVMGSNFTNLLWRKSLKAFEQLGLSSDMVRPFIERTYLNLLDDPKSSLTGPLSRGDTAITEKHLNLLKNSPDHQVYKSFVDSYLAEEKNEHT